MRASAPGASRVSPRARLARAVVPPHRGARGQAQFIVRPVPDVTADSPIVTGTTPPCWLLRQRVVPARQLPETTDLSVNVVAVRCGVGSAANLRTRSKRIVATTPAAAAGAVVATKW